MSKRSDLCNVEDNIARLEVLAHQRDEELFEAGRVIKRLQEGEQTKKNMDRDVVVPAELICGHNIRKGDRVRILIPRHKQPTKGDIVGITKDNMNKVRGVIRGTNIEETVRRHLKNLMRLK